MKLIYLCLVLLLSLFGCTNRFKLTPEQKEKGRLAGEIQTRTAQKLRQEKGLILIGEGEQMMYQIEMLALCFNYYKPLKIEEARELVLYAADQFLSEINNNKKIHRYLKNNPFTYGNVEITIIIYEENKQKVPKGELCSVVLADKMIKYRNYDVSTGQLTTFHKENCSDALNLVTQKAIAIKKMNTHQNHFPLEEVRKEAIKKQVL